MSTQKESQETEVNERASPTTKVDAAICRVHEKSEPPVHVVFRGSGERRRFAKRFPIHLIGLSAVPDRFESANSCWKPPACECGKEDYV